MGFIVRRVKVNSRLGDMLTYRVSAPKCRSCAETMSFYSGSDFSLVKREIERRGWGWEAEWSNAWDEGSNYRFVIAVPGFGYCAFEAFADSEELAGCRAFLKACEATSKVE